jgi:hypothetical protein
MEGSKSVRLARPGDIIRKSARRHADMLRMFEKDDRHAP